MTTKPNREDLEKAKIIVEEYCSNPYGESLKKIISEALAEARAEGFRQGIVVSNNPEMIDHAVVYSCCHIDNPPNNPPEKPCNNCEAIAALLASTIAHSTKRGYEMAKEQAAKIAQCKDGCDCEKDFVEISIREMKPE